MKRPTIALCLIAAICGAPALAVADAALRSTMHVWRSDARSLHDMLTGRSAFDEAAVRRALQTFATDAGQAAERANSATGAGREFKRRMLAFQAEAQSALGEAAQRPAVQAAFSRINADCHSCHDIFKN